MPIERKLAAIMFTDIAGYTALSAKDSTKASELLKTQRDTLKPIVEKYGGSWMKEIGDGLLLTFDSATSAVECSIAIQEATKGIEDLNLRIGIHEGEVIKQDGDVIGDDVNVASRIEPFSAIGGVAISQKIQQAISSNQEFETKYIGKPKLKGVSQEVKVYCITSHGLPETDVSKVSAKLEEESKFNIFAITGGILTAIGVAFWIAVSVFDVSFGGKTEVPSIGILMMENLGKEDEEFWSSGMTADLITKVKGAGLIRVAPIDDVLKLDKKLSLKEKAEMLGVKYILTHSFKIKDEGFDLWSTLENTENGVALFSNKISELMDMTPQMVGKLANDIVTSLNVKTKENIMKAPTTNVDAYEYYLKAKYKHENEDLYENENYVITEGLLLTSLELDDNLLIARDLLARMYRNYDELEKSMIVFMKNLDIAKDLSNTYYEASSLKGIGVIHRKKNDYDEALEYYNQSLEQYISINDKRGIAHIYNLLGHLFEDQNDYINVQKYWEKAGLIYQELDDIGGIHTNLIHIGHMHSFRGDYANALIYYKRAFELLKQHEEDGFVAQDFFICHLLMGEIYDKLGKYDKAIYYYGQLIDSDNIVSKHSHYFYDNLGHILNKQKNYHESIKYLSLADSISNNCVVTQTNLCLAYKKLGQAYETKTLNELIKEDEHNDYIYEYNQYYSLYELLEDKSYLETAYNQVKEKADNLEPDVAAKFLSYPIPKAIVEEWEKVK